MRSGILSGAIRVVAVQSGILSGAIRVVGVQSDGFYGETKQGAAAPCFDKFIRSNAGSRISPLFEYFYPEQYDRIEYVIVFSYRIRITIYP